MMADLDWMSEINQESDALVMKIDFWMKNLLCFSFEIKRGFA